LLLTNQSENNDERNKRRNNSPQRTYSTAGSIWNLNGTHIQGRLSLAILDNTGARLPLSSALPFIGCLTELTLIVSLDLFPSVRSENPCNPSWSTLYSSRNGQAFSSHGHYACEWVPSFGIRALASDKWSSVFSVVIFLVYWVLLLPAQILFKAKALTNGSSPSDAMTEILFYIPLKLDLALHVASAISLTLDFLFESKYISIGPTFLVVLHCRIQLVGRMLWCHEWYM